MKLRLVVVLLPLAGALVAIACKTNTITQQNIGATCSDNGECAQGTTCVLNLCRAPCTVNSDCHDPTLVCVAGGCTSPLPDAGATRADSGGDSGGDAIAMGPAFSTNPARVWVLRGTAAPVEVDLARNGFAQGVEITFTNLPAGVTSTTASIAPDAGSATVTLTATAAAKTGIGQATLHGAGVPDLVIPLTVAGPSGALDDSFNQSGVVSLIPPGGDARSVAQAVAIQADGAIVVAGNAGPGWGVARFHSDGSLDTAFAAELADGGTAASSLPGMGTVADVVVDANGRIFVAGSVPSGSELTTAVLALNPDGSPDAAFGVAGLWRYDTGVGYVQKATPAAIVSDGTGGVFVACSDGSFHGAIPHLDATGAQVTPPIKLPANIKALTVDTARNLYYVAEGVDDGGVPDIVVVGYIDDTGKSGPGFPGLVVSGGATVGDGFLDDAGGLVFSASGGRGPGIDGIFGRLGLDGGLLLDGGFVDMHVPVPGNSTGYARGVMQADGKVLLLGWGASSTVDYAYMQRLTLGAQPDLTFNPGGPGHGLYERTDGTTYQDVTIDAIGRIVLVGGLTGWSVTRLWP